jgi:holo-[acyl-carrier protein] synthase
MRITVMEFGRFTTRDVPVGDRGTISIILSSERERNRKRYPIVRRQNMIIGTGIDVAEVPRIRLSIERFGDRFLHVSIRQAKSAIAIRRRIGWNATPRVRRKRSGDESPGYGMESWRARWHDCEVIRLPGGPAITVHGKAGEIAARLGVKNAALSISHTGEQATAQVILES